MLLADHEHMVLMHLMNFEILILYSLTQYIDNILYTPKSHPQWLIFVSNPLTDKSAVQAHRLASMYVCVTPYRTNRDTVSQQLHLQNFLPKLIVSTGPVLVSGVGQPTRHFNSEDGCSTLEGTIRKKTQEVFRRRNQMLFLPFF